MALSVRIYEKDPCVFVAALGGSLDSSTYQDLEKKLQPFLMESTRALILDLKSLEYISSMGVSTILKAKKVVEEFGASFAMVNLQPQIRTVFDIIKALPSMYLFQSLEEADQYLAEMQRRAKEEADRNRQGA
jgi:anti-sigma B factor antagonist